MHHPVHKSLKAAYSFYNASTSTPWTQLMNDALVTAKKNGFDVFNALDLMENKTFLESLKFGIGDGNLHYYIYNWRCPNMPSQHVGLVLQWFVFSFYLAVLLHLAKYWKLSCFSTALKKNKKSEINRNNYILSFICDFLLKRWWRSQLLSCHLPTSLQFSSGCLFQSLFKIIICIFF